MIVTCERCSTQFQLDDSRVPDGGVRVRCSRCKCAFRVTRAAEADSEEPRPTELFEETVAQDSGSDETEELFGDSSLGVTEDEESDWQFNEEPRSEPAASSRVGEAAAASVVDGLLGESPASEATPEVEAPHEAAAIDSSSRAHDDTPPGLVIPPDDGDLFAAGLEDGEPSLSDDGPSIEFGASDADADADADDGLAAGLAPAPESEIVANRASDRRARSDGDATDELDSSEEWDLFGNAETVAVDDDLGAAPRADLPDGTDLDYGDSHSPNAWQRVASRAGMALAWSGVLCAFGWGIQKGVTLPLERGVALEFASPVAGLRIESETRFVEHVAAGPVLVISGMLHNETRRALPAPALGLALLDAAGDPVTLKPRALVAAHGERALREDALRSEERLIAAGGALGPGAARPFNVLVGPLPVDAQRFEWVQTERPVAPTSSAASSQDAEGPGTVVDETREETANVLSDEPVATTADAPASEPQADPANESPTRDIPLADATPPLDSKAATSVPGDSSLASQAPAKPADDEAERVPDPRR